MEDTQQRFEPVFGNEHRCHENHEIGGTDQESHNQHGRDPNAIHPECVQNTTGFRVSARAEDAANERVGNHSEGDPDAVKEEARGCHCSRIIGLDRKERKNRLTKQDQKPAEDHTHHRGENREFQGIGISTLAVALSNLFSNHHRASTANSNEENKEDLLNVFIDRVARIIFNALTCKYHYVDVRSDRPERFVEERRRGGNKEATDKFGRKGKEIGKPSAVRCFEKKNGEQNHNGLQNTSCHRADCRTAQTERGEAEMTENQTVVEIRFYHPGDITSSHTSHKNPQKSILFAFPISVKNALSQTLNVCAFVVFFAVLVKILNLFGILPAICKIFGGTALSKAAISGALEMTTGLFTLSPNADTLRTSLIMASAILGFGGFSVHAQALSFIVQSKLSPRTYIGGKFLHAILSAALTALFTANTYTLAVNPTRFLPIFCALFIFLAVLIKKHWKKSRG